MNIRQLHYVSEIERQGFHVSAAAIALNTSQPGISKQVRLLEKELGAQLFVREGGRLIGLTATGKEIIERVRRVILDTSYIYSVCRQKSRLNNGTLTIATTHVQACYVLPEVINRFRSRYPRVRITLRQTTPSHILELLCRGEADLGITSDVAKSRELIVLPCRDIDRVAIVPAAHPLLNARRVSLRMLAGYPLVTYETAFKSRERILATFNKAGLMPKIVLSVSDADVIKTCVERNMGIGVLLQVVYDQVRDKGLRIIPVSHLFPPARISVIVNRSHHLKMYEFDFIEEFSARWTRPKVQRAFTNARDFEPSWNLNRPGISGDSNS